MSTCGKCGGHFFEIEEVSAVGAKFKKYFFQCSSCGVPVGVADFFDNNSMLETIQSKLDSVNSRLDQMKYTLSLIEQKV